MKLKKIITSMLIIAILIAQISVIPFSNFVYAEETENPNSAKFHYNQLDNISKRVYDGIYEMYMQGILKTGTESLDLAKDDKYVTQEQLVNYMKGNTELKSAMNAARYAFYADYPEVFYINFQKLTLRVTKDNEEKYHAYIGSGNLKDYYVEGFTDVNQVTEAVTEFEARVSEIVEGANNIQVEENKNLTVEKIKYVHNEIIYNTSYRLESDCTPGNEGFIGTPYGALIKKQAVCEGYARAFKTILDRLGINCILVQGVHQSEGSAAVPHMWTYVEIEKETYTRALEKVWYAVDITFDDPYVRKIRINGNDEDRVPGEDIEEGFENTRYLLVGTETMNKEHVALETVEAAGNYVFKYPELNVEDYGMDTVVDSNGLLVKYKQEGTETEDYKSGDYYVSYEGKGYYSAAEDKKYIIMRSHYYKPGDEIWDISSWAYLDPEPYAGGFADYEDHIYIRIPNSEYVEFAVTTLEPGPMTEIENLTYKGDESDFVTRTQKLYNPSGTYKGRPYIKTQSPVQTAPLTIGRTYHVDVTYDDELVLANEGAQVGYRIESTGETGAEKSEITNLNFDGKNRITFDLKFSQMYADDNAIYRIYITGLLGKNSGKEPLEIVYGANNPILCAYRMNKAKNWEVFATPTLMENQDLSMNDWQTSDGTPVSDKLKSRIALVTTRTTTAQEEEMSNVMKEQLPEEKIIKSETYNISLNVCKKYVVKTGHRLRLSLGFPSGYGPEDEGVTFKAYHFMRDNNGNVTGVEEIPCVITQYGLIVTCDSFSPFAIAVVPNDGVAVSNEKTVIISSEEGGVIDGANREEGDIVTLNQSESKELIVRADEGYEVQTLTVCGETVNLSEAENKKEIGITLNYDDIKDGNNIVHATFVAETVAQNDIERNEALAEPIITPAVAVLPTERVASLNKSFVINSNVTETEGIVTYQWYKDGVKLEGKTSKNLSIDNVNVANEGKYTLKVTTTVGTVSKEAISNECTVTVRGFETSIEGTDTSIDLEKIEKGTEFDVDVNMSNFTNIGEGVLVISGQLEYDTNILDRLSITGQNGWELKSDSLNEENLKFVLENDNRITSNGGMLRIRFKVKDTLTQDIQTYVKIKNIIASGGYGAIASNDDEIAIATYTPEEPDPPTPPVEEKITSDVYDINNTDKDISRISPKTTIAVFKENVETEQEMIFIDKDGNALGDDAIIKTGMTLKVGKTLQYTLIVTGDLDSDGEVTTNDLAKIKLHLIEYEFLNGIYLKAADVDNDKEMSVNDAAQVKLVLINLLNL